MLLTDTAEQILQKKKFNKSKIALKQTWGLIIIYTIFNNKKPFSLHNFKAQFKIETLQKFNCFSLKMAVEIWNRER